MEAITNFLYMLYDEHFITVSIVFFVLQITLFILAVTKAKEPFWIAFTVSVFLPLAWLYVNLFKPNEFLPGAQNYPYFLLIWLGFDIVLLAGLFTRGYMMGNRMNTSVVWKALFLTCLFGGIIVNFLWRIVF